MGSEFWTRSATSADGVSDFRSELRDDVGVMAVAHVLVRAEGRYMWTASVLVSSPYGEAYRFLSARGTSPAAVVRSCLDRAQLWYHGREVTQHVDGVE